MGNEQCQCIPTLKLDRGEPQSSSLVAAGGALDAGVAHVPLLPHVVDQLGRELRLEGALLAAELSRPTALHHLAADVPDSGCDSVRKAYTVLFEETFAKRY